MDKQDAGAWSVCEATPKSLLNRRKLLQSGSAVALAAWLAMNGQGRAIAQTVVNPSGSARADIFVLIFLRGGADGLSILVPHGDSTYYSHRRTLGILKPAAAKGSGAFVTERTYGTKATEPTATSTAVNLDGFYGLHPALAALYPAYADGLLAPLHAVGSQDQTRSHFEAMATMERGLGGEDPNSGVASGWLARHLIESKGERSSPLRAVAWGEMLPDSLRGAMDVSVLRSLADYTLQVPSTWKNQTVEQTLRSLYSGDVDSATDSNTEAIERAGIETLATLNALKRIDPSSYKPANGAVYPASDLGQGLRQTACLIKGDVGLEAVALDRGGWDTHVGQGSNVGWMSAQLADVGDSIGAFVRDLGKQNLGRVTIAVMTEFGRRVEENGGLGTDHGRASAMFLLGGGIRGGKVYADWPGLTADRLDSVGDMRVTTDYRNVLAEVARHRLNNPRASALFPSFAATPLGIAIPRTMV